MSPFDLTIVLLAVLGAGFLIWWALYRLLTPRPPPAVTTLLRPGDAAAAQRGGLVRRPPIGAVSFAFNQSHTVTVSIVPTNKERQRDVEGVGPAAPDPGRSAPKVRRLGEGRNADWEVCGGGKRHPKPREDHATQLDNALHSDRLNCNPVDIEKRGETRPSNGHDHMRASAQGSQRIDLGL